MVNNLAGYGAESPLYRGMQRGRSAPCQDEPKAMRRNYRRTSCERCEQRFVLPAFCRLKWGFANQSLTRDDAINHLKNALPLKNHTGSRLSVFGMRNGIFRGFRWPQSGLKFSRCSATKNTKNSWAMAGIERQPMPE